MFLSVMRCHQWGISPCSTPPSLFLGNTKSFLFLLSVFVGFIPLSAVPVSETKTTFCHHHQRRKRIQRTYTGGPSPPFEISNDSLPLPILLLFLPVFYQITLFSPDFKIVPWERCDVRTLIFKPSYHLSKNITTTCKTCQRQHGT